MTTEDHLWQAMAGIHHEMGAVEADPLNEKLMQVLFALLRWQRDRVMPIRAVGLDVAVDRPRLAVVDHCRDRVAGIHIVETNGGNEAA